MKRSTKRRLGIRLVIAGIIVICAFVLVPTLQVKAHGSAAPFVVTLYNERNGLPTGEANTVLQTSDGYRQSQPVHH